MLPSENIIKFISIGDMIIDLLQHLHLLKYYLLGIGDRISGETLLETKAIFSYICFQYQILLAHFI
jgi:hypothetical protein